MMGYQAEGAAPIVIGQPIDDPHTVATAIKIGNPASWKSAEAARDESGGLIDIVTDAEILAAYRLIAAGGIFAEPASAASVAGALKYGAGGKLKPGSTVVCTLTGHGLKDPDTALKNLSNTVVVEPDVGRILKLLEIECMKYVIVHGDGMADWAVSGTGRQNAAASRAQAQHGSDRACGELGLVATIPAGMPPGSDVGTMTMLGYDPRRYHTGRAPIEAASMGLDIAADDVVFRMNLVTLAPAADGSTVMGDFTAGHISSEEAAAIVGDIGGAWPTANSNFTTASATAISWSGMAVRLTRC